VATQLEKTTATRQKLLDATIAVLIERGYKATSTPVICRRARVSRGGQLHHFKSKQRLVAAAVEHLFRRRLDELGARLAATRGGMLDLRSAALHLLAIYSGETFYAWLELVVAARSDRKLLREVSRITTQFFDTVLATYQELFPEIAAPNQRFDLVPAFTFAFLQGLALDRVAVENEQRVNDLLCMLKDLAALVLGPNPRPAGA
jgi:AcrR family transcriptional regulator